MSVAEPPLSSPHAESYGEAVSYPSDVPSSETSNSSNSLVTFYKPPTFLSLLRTAAINLILPFINGVMLGFGEIFAHELAFRWGWRGAKVYPQRRSIGPGLVVQQEGINASGTGLQVNEARRQRNDRRQLEG